MSIEDNKKLALDYFAYITTSRLEDALELLADDATQWIQGSPRTMTKADIQRLLTFELGTFEGDPVFKVNGTTCEDNRVAIECELDANLTNGKCYQNKYHVLVEVDGGKIKSIREYCDTAPARAAFSDFMPAQQ
jgi:ketosteroid isomerase-like protein